MVDSTIYYRAVNKWGAQFQIELFMEEAAELAIAINHYKRNRGPFSKIVEEYVDLTIMVRQFEVIHATRVVRESECMATGLNLDIRECHRIGLYAAEGNVNGVAMSLGRIRALITRIAGGDEWMRDAANVARDKLARLEDRLNG